MMRSITFNENFFYNFIFILLRSLCYAHTGKQLIFFEHVSTVYVRFPNEIK